MMVGKLKPRRGFTSLSIITIVSCAFLVLFSILKFSQTTSSANVSKAKTSFGTVPTNRDNGVLPDFTNGGIVVFYHIYKTGGSTVGKLLHELAQKDQSRFPVQKKTSLISYADMFASPARMFFAMIRKRVDWEKDCLPPLDMAESENKLMLLELHVEHPAPDFPSLVELAPIIEKWRAEANRRGVGFFAFTLLREPVAHALSFFNFFHVGNVEGRPPPTLVDHDFWNPFRPLSSTEKNFLHSYYVNNRQCRMLNSDPQATFGAPLDLVWDRHVLSPEEFAESKQPCPVEKVHDAFFKSLDWVGTTENLQNETLPLLTKIIVNDPSLGRNNAPFKVFDNNPTGYVGMKKYDLSGRTMGDILKRTELDRGLYAEVNRNFRLTDLGWDYRSPVNG